MELLGETTMQGGLTRPAAAWAEPAFEAVFLEYYPRVFAVLYRMLGDRARAEELASDTFVKLSQQPAGKLDNVGGWLFRTATRLGIDWLRAARRRKHYEQQAADWAASVPDPLGEVLREERCRAVRAALARLKPAQAQLLMLRSSGCSYRELSHALGIRYESVGRMLMRAEAAFEKAYRRVAKEDSHARF